LHAYFVQLFNTCDHVDAISKNISTAVWIEYLLRLCLTSESSFPSRWLRKTEHLTTGPKRRYIILISGF